MFFIVRSRQRVRMIAALAGVALAAVLFAPQSVFDRISGMQYLGDTETLGQSDVSAEQRFVIMKVAVAVASANPIFGVGIGTYPNAHRAMARSTREWALARGTRDSHNTYLRVLTETGLIGFVLFGMFFVTSYNELRKHVQSLKRSTSPADKELYNRCQAFQAIFAGMAICGFFGSLNQVAFVFLLAIMGSAMVRFPRASESEGHVAVAPARSRFRGGLGAYRRAVAR
ncbi:MAG: O-antigen ligase family protein [Phycisphaerae bacterium]|nr:O-antigen ligase family protein [Gemmatimonadaceae bacterium]